MDKAWKKYDEEKPATAGIYEWRVPSEAVPGLVVQFEAHMLRRTGRSDFLAPLFGYWDGYRSHVPAGTEWRECEPSDLYKYNIRRLSVVGLRFTECIFCGEDPALKGVRTSGNRVVVGNDAHKYNSWWLECCRWGKTPHLEDPRELEEMRRKAFPKLCDGELGELRIQNDLLRKSLQEVNREQEIEARQRSLETIRSRRDVTGEGRFGIAVHEDAEAVRWRELEKERKGIVGRRLNALRPRPKVKLCVGCCHRPALETPPPPFEGPDLPLFCGPCLAQELEEAVESRDQKHLENHRLKETLRRYQECKESNQ